MKKTALICGISGQDGAWLAQHLLSKGYTVHGTSRDAQLSTFHNLKLLNIFEQVRVESMAPIDFRSVVQTVARVKPDEIYNLAGQSSVGLSFQQPVETLESIAVGALNLLEALRFTGIPAKLYNAASSECFGNTYGEPANENTPFYPRSPYAVAKATAFWEVANYREAYGLFACSGILFNHESHLRPERFVTKKIVSTAQRIAQGSKVKLQLGNIDIQRDWGWAPEYVDAMHQILQLDAPEDFVIATGATNSLRDFLVATFEHFDLDWHDHVTIDYELQRPTDIKIGRADPGKAKRVLGWQAKYKMKDVVRLMIEFQQRDPG